MTSSRMATLTLNAPVRQLSDSQLDWLLGRARCVSLLCLQKTLTELQAGDEDVFLL